MTRTVFIGTGNIAAVHAESLAGMKQVDLVAVVDPVTARAEEFAARYRVPAVYSSVGEALAAGGFDVAHVLTPPATHFAIARQLLEAGLAVFVEKPMAEETGECDTLMALAAENQAALRVNQNYIHHPAHLKLRRALADNRLGPVRHVSCAYAMPLRQLAARQFGHWMFDSPRNLLLEQVVHPLSLIDDIAGPLTLVSAHASAPRDFADGISLVTGWMLAFEGPQATAQLQVSLGVSCPDWSVKVQGEDGLAEADYLANVASVSRPGGYIDFLDTWRRGAGEAASRMLQDAGNAAAYLGAQAKLLKRNDAFFQSIRNSVADFYRSLEGSHAELDGARGRRLVALCNEVAGQGPQLQSRPAPAVHDGFRPDVVILGGTGFIGSYLTRDLVGAGKKVRVVARNTGNPARVFTHENVEMVRGSIGDRATLDEALQGVPSVVNLAHGGGGDSWAAIRKALVGGAQTVADAVAAAGAEKFLHVSSIAALYLGDPETVITHETPADDSGEERADYARAKAEAERLLLARHEENGLPVSLFRPGVVVGEGTSPFHSGVGFYNRERVCLGWNGGTNPLPFVLVEDVSAALVAALLEVPAEKLAGESFNLVGDVRLTAREYTALLAEKTGRPLVYRPQFLWQQQAGEIAKWTIKKAAGRKVPFPPMRDLRSRGMPARFDTGFEKQCLGWHPVADRQSFVERAIAVHVR